MSSFLTFFPSSKRQAAHPRRSVLEHQETRFLQSCLQEPDQRKAELQVSGLVTKANYSIQLTLQIYLSNRSVMTIPKR